MLTLEDWQRMSGSDCLCTASLESFTVFVVTILDYIRMKSHHYITEASAV